MEMVVPVAVPAIEPVEAVVPAAAAVVGMEAEAVVAVGKGPDEGKVPDEEAAPAATSQSSGDDDRGTASARSAVWPAWLPPA